MSGGTIANATFDIVVQVRQDIDEDISEKIVSTGDDTEDEVVKEEGVAAESGDLGTIQTTHRSGAGLRR